MISAWTRHIKDDEERIRFETSIRHSKWLLDHLSLLLDQEERDLNRSEISQKTYEMPSWAYLQAHKNGFRQCLGIIKKLITLDPKDDNDRKPITN